MSPSPVVPPAVRKEGCESLAACEAGAALLTNTHGNEE